MTPDEWKYILGLFGTLSSGALIGGVVVFFFLKSFIPNYLSQKAANLATKEDISAITDKVEQVKAQYAILLEDFKARHQLRMGALEKRLAVHQEAFTLWRELFNSVHSSELGNIVVKCQEWWEKNCLYLEPDVRQAFASAFYAAHNHPSYLQNRASPELARDNWKIITDFPNLLFKAIQLPSLTPNETKAIGVSHNENSDQ